MKKKKEPTASMRKEELQKQLKRKSAAMEKMKRELKIEAALERVRARTMAMQKSDELAETVSILFKQLLRLGIKATQMRTCAIVTLKPDEPVGECWITKPDGDIIPQSFMVPYDETSAYKTIYAAWKQGEKFLVVHLSGDALVQHLSFLKKHANIPTQQFQTLPDQPIETYTHAIFFSQGYLFVISNKPLPAYHDVFRRFGAVFQQTYTRFLDLQKAEAQAREAQIETALEKVRSSSLAVHKSDEFKEVVTVVFERLQELEIPVTAAGINIFIQGSKDLDSYTCGLSENGLVISHFRLLYFDHVFANDLVNAHENRLDFFSRTYAFEEKNIYWEYQLNNSDLRHLPADIKNMILRSNSYSISMALAKHSMIAINDFEGKLLSEKEKDILKRFVKVFEQAYIRFLDLQKAEEQARESQIQLAMERVRARTMAMQKSDELPEAANLLFLQMQALGMPAWSAGYCIWDHDKQGITLWMSSEGVMQPSFHMPLTDDISLIHMKEAHEKKEFFHVEAVGGDELVLHYKYMRKLPGIGEILDSIIDAGHPLPTFQIFHCAYFSQGFLLFITYEPVPEAHDIFKRFAKVFEQTYTRFLDLQKAEAQARESQIQLALERVRARTMAMQKSDELSETVFILFQQFKQLGENPDQATIGIINESEWVIEYWVTMYGNQTNRVYKFPIDELNVTNRIYKAWKEQKKSLVIELSGKELYDFANFRESMGGAAYNEKEKKRMINVAFFSKGIINVQSNESRSEESIRLLERFAAVFEQTYTRFLDLQKAEAQARESQIEAALERVRSRSMAMQKSEELKEVIQVVYEQFVHLNIHVEHTGFIMDYKERDDMHIWLADKHAVPFQVTIPYFDCAHWNSFNKAKEKGLDFFANHLNFEEKNKFYQDLFKLIPGVPEETLEYYFSCPGLAISTVLLENIGLYIENFSGTPYSDEDNNTLMRFGKVFQQTYTRFLDLQKAEAQAREAQIEAALERVRSRSLAMHKADELGEVITVIFDKLKELNFSVADGVALVTFIEGSKDLNEWMANPGFPSAIRFHLPYFEHPVLSNFWNAKNQGADFIEGRYTAEENRSFLEHIFEYSDYKHTPKEIKDFCLTADFYANSIAFQKNTAIFINDYSGHSLSELEIKILKRFLKVFEQAYIRFLDLQKAEAQALEAIKRASVDRVRAEIASMRTISDLERIQPLIWNELTTLGVPFIRCGVFIMDEDQQQVHTFLSTPEGKAIATLHVPFAFNLSIITNGVSHWRKKKMYKEYWDASAFAKSWAALSSLRETSEGSHRHEQPPENLYLHMLPFLQGMLYVGNDTALNEDELQLVQNLADAFATAYARYEDFNKLEAAKKQVDSTLNELQVTQKQLIQSEKMASLGELTAGIAHEIQNPLNFVNNFSEVSNELISEMVEEVDKGNTEEVKAIANDIKQNLEKINHHGKRADAIVKGMLQHSRSSTGVKEATDINALADEYLRLAYHGLRAKNKDFNSALNTDYDETIGKINIIPQDIGRVLLNLYNNAFYAVNEKLKRKNEKYEPTVSVSTKKEGNEVIISVLDNGNGIPQNIIDKIFQPFFTTKPTGSGTGLGLSLAYDIVKARGGELKVKTKEGEGSEFIIQLRNN